MKERSRVREVKKREKEMREGREEKEREEGLNEIKRGAVFLSLYDQI